ncbi:endonuclease III [Rubidibacter lacunae KORDI 51-2]|uniref:Endonuclease III n=1 Tax=Rubidibacter lacunae KORDI 51-2 TaxID=582515 RepID=U5D985_9CHRO|nr:endonuclease III [Rubidibacter lacunae]ERN41138.1 endonuclease III [Rubidibacter lacunae KORDI 51-2]
MSPRKAASQASSRKTGRQASTRVASVRRQRALAVLERLKQLYPNATCTLDYDTPLQLLVATILSAQCTDERVNKVTPELFARFPDATAFAIATSADIEPYVRSTGFYRNKAKNIQAACARIVSDFGGEVPSNMEALLTLAGVARKTANVVLAHGFGIIGGVTVDTHVKRLSRRLGLTQRDDPGGIEKDLMQLLPQPDWENWSIRLIYHGRQVCKARKPDCAVCELNALCPSAEVKAEGSVADATDDR